MGWPFCSRVVAASLFSNLGQWTWLKANKEDLPRHNKEITAFYDWKWCFDFLCSGGSGIILLASTSLVELKIHHPKFLTCCKSQELGVRKKFVRAQAISSLAAWWTVRGDVRLQRSFFSRTNFPSIRIGTRLSVLTHEPHPADRE